MLREKEISLQVVLLLLGGSTLVITGGVLFAVFAGGLPFYEKGLHGLLLFIVALQMVVLGETPFGTMKRSSGLIGAGALVAAGGIVTCFIPGILGELPRRLLFFCLAPGGFFLLLEMLFSPKKLRAWVQYGGIFRHLIAGCGAAYSLSVFVGLSLWRPAFLPLSATALGALLYGGALLYLAWILQRIYRAYPEARRNYEAEGSLTPDQTMILFTSLFMILLGVLLIPVSFGKLPFSGSAQLGLLMVIFAIQMLASGSTPLGPFPRSPLMVFLGLFFGGLGVISCVVPGMLTGFLTGLIGILNLLGGALTFGKSSMALLGGRKTGSLPGILVRLYAS